MDAERGAEATAWRDHVITPTDHSAPATDALRARPNIRAVQELPRPASTVLTAHVVTPKTRPNFRTQITS